MKLKIKKSEDHHTELVSSCSWAPDNKLYTLSNKTILTWDYNGEYISQFLEMDISCTCIEWGPSSQIDTIALGTSDGTLKVISKTGKVEKIVDSAHSTAIICIKWNSDGQAIATSGEDGIVLLMKIICFIQMKKIFRLNLFLKEEIKLFLGKLMMK